MNDEQDKLNTDGQKRLYIIAVQAEARKLLKLLGHDLKIVCTDGRGR